MNAFTLPSLIRLATFSTLAALFATSLIAPNLVNFVALASIYGIAESLVLSYTKKSSLPRGISGNVVRYVATDKAALERHVA